MSDTAMIMNKGMNNLLEKLGVVDTEFFISHLLREPFEPQPSPKGEGSPLDYTKWRWDNLYTDISLHDLNQKVAQYAKDHPFKKA